MIYNRTLVLVAIASVYVFIITCSIADTAMGNLALSFNDLGNHADALVLLEKVLEFRRRVLPKDHPDIGDAKCMPFVHLLLLPMLHPQV